jgi:hypothetical protein
VKPETRAAGQQVLQKVEGNLPYLCYAGVGLFLPLYLLQPAAAVFVLSWWACCWILYFSLCAVAVEHRHDPTHWSQGPWFRKYVQQWEVETAESREEDQNSSEALCWAESVS